jgi:hyperosmotically inducible protein
MDYIKMKPTNYLSVAGVFALCILAGNVASQNLSGQTATSVEDSSVGKVIDDSVVTARVKALLISDEAVKSLLINITTYKGDVMLSGFAENQAQVDRMILATQGVPGVKKVTDKLSIKEGTQTIGNKVDDSVITVSIKSALLGDAMMRSMDVSVSTRKGEVQLSGFLDNALQLNRAIELANGVKGVNKLINHMVVKE